MSTYRLTFSLPQTKDSPSLPVTVEADDEESAIDIGFDEAFREYPQYGGFQLDSISAEEPS
jgi:hypothetical protein